MDKESVLQELRELADYFKVDENDRIAIITRESGHILMSEVLEDICNVMKDGRPRVY